MKVPNVFSGYSSTFSGITLDYDKVVGYLTEDSAYNDGADYVVYSLKNYKAASVYKDTSFSQFSNGVYTLNATFVGLNGAISQYNTFARMDFNVLAQARLVIPVPSLTITKKYANASNRTNIVELGDSVMCSAIYENSMSVPLDVKLDIVMLNSNGWASGETVCSSANQKETIKTTENITSTFTKSTAYVGVSEGCNSSAIKTKMENGGFLGCRATISYVLYGQAISELRYSTLPTYTIKSDTNETILDPNLGGNVWDFGNALMSLVFQNTGTFLAFALIIFLIIIAMPLIIALIQTPK
jgi:hypothetical protein